MRGGEEEDVGWTEREACQLPKQLAHPPTCLSFRPASSHRPHHTTPTKRIHYHTHPPPDSCTTTPIHHTIDPPTEKMHANNTGIRPLSQQNCAVPHAP